MGRVLAAYGGGFKPPTRGHFEIVQKALNEFPEIDEFTVFIKVRIDSLNEFSKLIPLMLSNEVRIKSDKIKINTVKKYLLISLKSKLIFVKINLFVKIFFGLLNDRI